MVMTGYIHNSQAESGFYSENEQLEKAKLLANHLVKQGNSF